MAQSQKRYLTTTGRTAVVVLNDLDLSFTHPTDKFDLTGVRALNQIDNSRDLQNAIINGAVVVYDQNGLPIGNLQYKLDDDLERSIISVTNEDSIDSYRNSFYFQVQACNSETMSASSTLETGKLHCYPFSLNANLVPTTIAVNYLSGGTLPFKLKFGIYRVSQGTLVWQSPEITVSVAATYAVAGIGGLEAILSSGIYYFAILHDSVTPVSFTGGTRDNTKPVLDSGFVSITGTVTNRQFFTLAYANTLPPDLSVLPGASSSNNAFTVPYVFFKTI